MKLLACAIGMALTALGLYGLAVPSAFLSMADFFRTAPDELQYFAALSRIAAGLFLIAAARRTRLAWGMYLIGGMVVLVGLITPFRGNEAAAILFQWGRSGGTAVLRSWAAIAFLLGALVVYATVPTWRRPD